MDMKEHLITMAHYHKWAYLRLLASLDNVEDSDYFADKDVFFKSIHGTLNHLHAVDIIWLSRFQQTACPIKTLDEEVYAGRNQLKQALIEYADLWIEFTQKIDNAPHLLVYKQMNGEPTKRPYLSAMAHVFNHGTHHRGQITAIISQLGKVTPELDLSYYLAGLVNS